ncbi:uncharacterized protein LOC111622711 [Centruroides sculpturatus]|uniref:uncharacterized protein LOC111622711 n=1 Tax=Centruroides sculpturatus TaxID=218467 RepID=UPI000C6D78CC|nr:uncharacterized protein LOC111622711 [Centruroides sculpturatus]
MIQIYLKMIIVFCLLSGGRGFERNHPRKMIHSEVNMTLLLNIFKDDKIEPLVGRNYIYSTLKPKLLNFTKKNVEERTHSWMIESYPKRKIEYSGDDVDKTATFPSSSIPFNWIQNWKKFMDVKNEEETLNSIASLSRNNRRHPKSDKTVQDRKYIERINPYLSVFILMLVWIFVVILMFLCYYFLCAEKFNFIILRAFFKKEMIKLKADKLGDYQLLQNLDEVVINEQEYLKLNEVTMSEKSDELLVLAIDQLKERQKFFQSEDDPQSSFTIKIEECAEKKDGVESKAERSDSCMWTKNKSFQMEKLQIRNTEMESENVTKYFVKQNLPIEPMDVTNKMFRDNPSNVKNDLANLEMFEEYSHSNKVVSNDLEKGLITFKLGHRNLLDSFQKRISREYSNSEESWRFDKLHYFVLVKKPKNFNANNII